MNKRRHFASPSGPRASLRTVQSCLGGVAVLMLLIVSLHAFGSPRASPPPLLEDNTSLLAKSERLGRSSHDALRGLRDSAALALSSFQKQRAGQAKLTAHTNHTARHRIVAPPASSPIAYLVMNTSLPAKLPPSDTMITKCRSLSLRVVETIPTYYQCTYGLDDVVSSFVHLQGYWRDCLPQVALATLARMYMPPNSDGSFSTIDVGGNIGACTSLLASRGFYVAAFEPVFRNLMAFHQTIFANEMEDRVVLVGAAASDASLATKVITIEVGNHGNSAVINPKLPVGAALARTMEKVETERITTVRLDDLTGPSTHAHFAKFDCQGCELGALRGAETTLLSKGAIDILYVEVDTRLSRANGHEPQELLDLLHRHSYRMYVAYGNVTKRLHPVGFRDFVVACVEDPRDVVAVSADVSQRVPEDVLRQVMGLSAELLAQWLTDANYTEYGSIPINELLSPTYES